MQYKNNIQISCASLLVGWLLPFMVSHSFFIDLFISTRQGLLYALRSENRVIVNLSLNFCVVVFDDFFSPSPVEYIFLK